MLSEFLNGSPQWSLDAYNDPFRHTDDIQTTTWTFKDIIPAGTKATLTINYTGILNNNMAGMFFVLVYSCGIN